MSQLRQIYSNRHPRWLEDDIILWRYMPLERLFCYLNGNIFLPSIAKLCAEDPFEGEGCADDAIRFRNRFRRRDAKKADQVEKWIRDQVCSTTDRDKMGDKDAIELNGWESNAAACIFQRQYFEFLRTTRFAWCWYRSRHESAAMWRTYGKGGVAVATDIAKLRQVLAGQEFLFGEMQYVPSHAGRLIDPASESPDCEDLQMHPYFWKRQEYEHEHEVRFIAAGPAREGNGAILPGGVPASDWITKVRLWPKLTPAEEKCLTKAIQDFIPQLDCRCSDLYGRHSPGEELYEDLMKEHPEEEHLKWGDYSDGIPPGMKEL
jgi:hypothetical protein